MILVLLFHDPAAAPSRNVSGEICLPISLPSESLPSEDRFKFERTTRGSWERRETAAEFGTRTALRRNAHSPH